MEKSSFVVIMLNPYPCSQKNIDAYFIFMPPFAQDFQYQKIKKLPIYIIHFLLVGSDNQNVFFCHLSVKKICIKGMSIIYFATQSCNV